MKVLKDALMLYCSLMFWCMLPLCTAFSSEFTHIQQVHQHKRGAYISAEYLTLQVSDCILPILF